MGGCCATGGMVAAARPAPAAAVQQAAAASSSPPAAGGGAPAALLTPAHPPPSLPALSFFPSRWDTSMPTKKAWTMCLSTIPASMQLGVSCARTAPRSYALGSQRRLWLAQGRCPLGCRRRVFSGAGASCRLARPPSVHPTEPKSCSNHVPCPCINTGNETLQQPLRTCLPCLPTCPQTPSTAGTATKSSSAARC